MSNHPRLVPAHCIRTTRRSHHHSHPRIDDRRRGVTRRRDGALRSQIVISRIQISIVEDFNGLGDLFRERPFSPSTFHTTNSFLDASLIDLPFLSLCTLIHLHLSTT